MEPPPTLRHAHRALVAELNRGIEQYGRTHSYSNADAICEAVYRFVFELQTVPAWRNELDWRAAFIERGCGDGSPWREAASKAMPLLPEELDTDDPKEPFLTVAGIGTPKRLRNIGGSPGAFIFSSDLREAITCIERVLDSNALLASSVPVLEEWRNQTKQLLDDALNRQADGCYWLHRVGIDRDKRRGKTALSQQGNWMGGGFLKPMLDAADLLVEWMNESPPAAKMEQREGNGNGPSLPSCIREIPDATLKWNAASAWRC